MRSIAPVEVSLAFMAACGHSAGEVEELVEHSWGVRTAEHWQARFHFSLALVLSSGATLS